MNVATLHLCAVAFWYGLVGAEFIIERSRTESKQHGYSVARNHYWIDLCLEIPVAVIVLATGISLIATVEMTSLHMAEIAAGVIAVGTNLACAIPVILRKKAADTDSLADVIRHSRMIDRISLFGIPAGVVALILGLYLRG